MMKKSDGRKRKEAALVTIKVELAVLPEFYELLNRTAMRDGLSARRWSAERLAELLGIPKEQALPPYHGYGRPRKYRGTNGAGTDKR